MGNTNESTPTPRPRGRPSKKPKTCHSVSVFEITESVEECVPTPTSSVSAFELVPSPNTEPEPELDSPPQFVNDTMKQVFQKLIKEFEKRGQVVQQAQEAQQEAKNNFEDTKNIQIREFQDTITFLEMQIEEAEKEYQEEVQYATEKRDKKRKRNEQLIEKNKKIIAYCQTFQIE